MVAPRIGYGTFLQVETTPGMDDFVTIARLTEIGEFGGDVDDIEITNHDTAEPVREYIRGLAEPGEISFTGIWIADPTQFEIHDEVFVGIVPNRNFKVILPDSGGSSMGEATFSGFFAAFRLNPQIDGRIEFTGRVKLSGSFTLEIPV